MTPDMMDEPPETWHDVDTDTLDEAGAWIQQGHPDECEERLEQIAELGELRYHTLRARFLAHVIREHEAGLETLAKAFEHRGVHGRSAEFLRDAIRDHGDRFADEILEGWGEFSKSSSGLAAVGTVVHALRKPSRETPQPTSINQLAHQSGASFGWVHEIVTDLADREWIDLKEGVEAGDPVALFEWWAENRTEPEAQTFHVPDPEEVAEKLLHDVGIDHAVTTYYAENALQGHLYPRRLDTYVREDDLDRAREAIVELGGSLGGTNFRLLTGDDAVVDEGVIGQGAGTLLYAPVPQVILDLITEGGSAREAADLLIQRAYPDA